MLEAKTLESGKAQLRFLFAVAINALPYMKKGMKSNDLQELVQLLMQYTQRLFEQISDEESLYHVAPLRAGQDRPGHPPEHRPKGYGGGSPPSALLARLYDGRFDKAGIRLQPTDLPGQKPTHFVLIRR